MNPANNERAANARTTIEVVTIAIAIAALIFTGVQTFNSTKATNAQIWQGLTQESLEIAKIMVDHPEIRPYFYEGINIDRNNQDYNRVMAVAEMYLDLLESFHDDYVRGIGGMEEDGDDWSYWQAYFRDMFRTSPVITKMSIEKQNWYSTDFSEYRSSESNTNAQQKNNQSERRRRVLR